MDDVLASTPGFEAARAELEGAVGRNEEARRRRQTPPVGQGALKVLRRRAGLPDAEPSTRRSRADGPPVPAPGTATTGSGAGLPGPSDTVAAQRVSAPPIQLRPMLLRGAPVTDQDLSVREREVLHVLSRGLPNGDIAAELFIGTETVKSHLQSIYRKLGLTCRSEAIVFALNNSDDPRIAI